VRNFLRENWLYIVAPLVLVLLLLGALMFFGSDPSSPFAYNLF
jgi:hypothetical protein